jgi:hypothetical protein
MLDSQPMFLMIFCPEDGRVTRDAPEEFSLVGTVSHESTLGQCYLGSTVNGIAPAEPRAARNSPVRHDSSLRPSVLAIDALA